MTVYYQLDLIMEGSPDELKEMLGVVSLYTGKRSQYFYDFKANGKPVDFKNLTDDIIAELISQRTVKITAAGPFGGYSGLNEVDIFRELSEVAGEAYFKAEIDGSGTYEVQNLKCEYKDGKLKITTYYEDNEERDAACEEAWKTDFIEKLPAAEFKKMFRITGDDFEEDTYRQVIEEMMEFDEMEFDDFISIIEDCGVKTELEEEELIDILENDLYSLDIFPYGAYSEFKFEYDGGDINEYVYNPATKSYEGNF